jgi:hypothetical protein
MIALATLIGIGTTLTPDWTSAHERKLGRSVELQVSDGVSSSTFSDTIEDNACKTLRSK